MQQICIVGGGTAGWLAALALAHFHKSIEDATGRSACQVTLVESEQIGTIGVGEATIPPFLDTLRSLDIDEAEFIKATGATFKLGIQFTHWKDRHSSYTHPFGQIGQNIAYQDFYHCFLKAKQHDDSLAYLDYSPAHAMMRSGKFYVPSNASNTPIQAAAYALHIDAGLAAKFFRARAESLGVTRIEGKVESVETDDHKENITQLSLDSGRAVDADLFFDCTGFSALLIGEALNSPYEDWSEYLMVNRALTVQTEADAANLAPYTESRAQDFGWTWHIPLQHRIGNGYVFNKDMCSDEQALQTLHANLSTKAVNEPRFINFKSGVRRQSWRGNCVALGLASGFLEPLESTAIHMICRALRVFLRLYPEPSNPSNMQIMAHEFNRTLSKDFEEIRDFLILHYCETRRNDTAFWQFYQNMSIPESLAHKISIFKTRGLLRPGHDDLFKDVNWYSVFDGMGVKAKSYDPAVDSVSLNTLSQNLMQMRTSIERSVSQLPTHNEFIRKHCHSTL
ncbi:tryptophan halogenase family protein [Ningiella sp. W23]|uniref:tryptophan halogenase family protein n=1 Tax=Ningiella sp. W23 TaxID=3023715 RepID=UPI0037576EA8